MEKYFSLEFLLVILSVILILALPKILITIARKSKVGLGISIAIVGIIIISLMYYFVKSYNIRNSFEGQNHIYGRVVSIISKNEFVVNSVRGTYNEGSIGKINVQINKNTSIYSQNMFENINTIKVGDFVTVVCSDEAVIQNKLNAIRVVKAK